MNKSIPMFPLSILPLPGELVPLHIFEPRYRQLLQDAETDDIAFGIYFNHAINEEKIGSLMKLESVIKRYATGESDIVVKGYDVFTMNKLYRNYKSKLYPGGDVLLWQVLPCMPASKKLESLFHAYLTQRNIKQKEEVVTQFTVAQALSLEVNERYQFLTAQEAHREQFLCKLLDYKLKLLVQEEKSRDVFHLN